MHKSLHSIHGSINILTESKYLLQIPGIDFINKIQKEILIFSRNYN